MKTLRTAMAALLIALLAPALQAQDETPQPADAAPQEPASPECRPFSFVLFGDSQPYGQEFSPVLQAITTQVGRLEIPFVIGLGDYIDGSSNQTTVRRQYQGFFRAMQPLQAQRAIPVALAPGNHDIRGIHRNAEIFCEFFQKLYLSFNYEGCHFVIRADGLRVKDDEVAAF
ncbi:MAG TPA: hypothetical protein DEP45_13700, partial [Armatimonadetes bacterium]|nr:hypothetical protein [Armatimonadota bacterium]